MKILRLASTVRSTEKKTSVRNTEERRKLNDVNPPDLSLVGIEEIGAEKYSRGKNGKYP